ncbi:preprotein translocase subunit SecE [Desulfovibrionales bacterium]
MANKNTVGNVVYSGEDLTAHDIQVPAITATLASVIVEGKTVKSKIKSAVRDTTEHNSNSRKTASASGASALIDKVQKLREYFENAKIELEKITWPTRKETVTTSIAVVVLVFVMSLFLGIVDLGMIKIVAFVLS